MFFNIRDILIAVINCIFITKITLILKHIITTVYLRRTHPPCNRGRLARYEDLNILLIIPYTLNPV